MRLRSATSAQAAVLVAAATAGVLVAATAGSSAAPSVRYLTTAAAPATVTDTISATGTVAAAATLDLAFGATNEPVTAVHVHVGQAVRAGQLLATVDGSSAQAQLAAAEAAVTEATSVAGTTTASSTTGANGSTVPTRGGAGTTVCRTTTVTISAPAPSPSAALTPSTSAPAPSPTATQSATPSRSSRPTGKGPGSSDGTTKTTRTCTTTSSRTSGTTTSRSTDNAGGGSFDSGTTLSSAEQQLAAAQAAVAATQLTAPQAGIVTAVNAGVGTLPGTPAVEVRTTAMNVQVPVQEQDAPNVRTGQVANISYSALGVTGTGVVSANALEPSSTLSSSSSAIAAFLGGSTQAVVTYPVTVTITDPPPGLLPGMSAAVSWVATSRSDVLAVPTSALQGSDAGTVVRVLVGIEPRTVPVSIGLSTSSLTQITAGLRAGDKVITGASTG